MAVAGFFIRVGNPKGYNKLCEEHLSLLGVPQVVYSLTGTRTSSEGDGDQQKTTDEYEYDATKASTLAGEWLVAQLKAVVRIFNALLCFFVGIV